MIGIHAHSPRSNRILGALPMTDYLKLAPSLEPVQVEAGQVMQAAGVACAHAHFPVDCAVTLVSATRDGEMSELALIGREGVVGLPALLGSSSLALQSVALRPGLAYRLPASVFSQSLQSSAALQVLSHRLGIWARAGKVDKPSRAVRSRAGRRGMGISGRWAGRILPGPRTSRSALAA